MSHHVYMCCCMVIFTSDNSILKPSITITSTRFLMFDVTWSKLCFKNTLARVRHIRVCIHKCVYLYSRVSVTTFHTASSSVNTFSCSVVQFYRFCMFKHIELINQWTVGNCWKGKLFFFFEKENLLLILHITTP